MTSHTRATLWRAAVAAALVGLAGCGAYAGTAHTPRRADPAGHAGPPSALAGEPFTVSSAVDRRIARDSVARLSDLPAGWIETRQASVTAQNKCRGLVSARQAVSGRADPGWFISTAARAELQSAVYLYSTTAKARAWFSLVSGPGTRACVGRLLREGLVMAARAQRLSVGQVNARPLAIDPVGDQRAPSRLTVRVSGPGASETAVLDVVVVRAGRGIAITLFGGASAPFKPDLRSRLLNAVTGRLTAGLTQASPVG